jgi:hypothetical protein
MSVRLFHRGARLVFVARHRPPGDARWWAPSLQQHDWGSILLRPLVLLGLEPHLDDPESISCRLGRLVWTSGAYWTTIELHLNGGSTTKRKLVAAALLKAARYGRYRSGS